MTVNSFRSWKLAEPDSRRTYFVIRIRTDEGLAGYGEGPELPANAEQLVVGLSAQAFQASAGTLAAHPGLAAAFNMAALDVLGQKSKAPAYQVLG